MKKTFENTTIIYQDGTSEHYEIIKVTNTGVLTGRKIKIPLTQQTPLGYEIIFYGFIPQHSIKQIKK